MPRASTICVSSATPYSGRRMKSCCSRLSATVACTSTPANSVSSGVATTSRVPSAVVPTNTSLSLKVLASRQRRSARPPPRRRGRCAWRLDSAAADCSCRRAARSVPSSSISDEALTLRTRSAMSRVPVAAATAASASAGIDAAVELQQQRHAPQDAVGIGRGVQKPDAPAACVRIGRLQMAPVARKKGSSASSSPRRMMARPSGCCTHALEPSAASSNVSA